MQLDCDDVDAWLGKQARGKEISLFLFSSIGCNQTSLLTNSDMDGPESYFDCYPVVGLTRRA